MFLKYFILEKYPARSVDKLSTKRTKTNQSAIMHEDRNVDSLVGMLCFETYRMDESISQVYKLMTKLIVTPSK